MVSFVQASIYLYDTEDSASVEVYDCLYHESMLYCRRPSQPIRLQREKDPHLCHHQGISHSFFSLWQKNVSAEEVLHGWRSSLDKADDYAHYLASGNKSMETVSEYLCQCNDAASFGRHCEYLLPAGAVFDQTVSAKFQDKTKKLMYVGNIVCYTTLECNFGLLCLDWRDICDGKQQCMSGYDEENCDKLELNECEDDEYRCENGMCLPDEYFLDGDYDCMDSSDEREPINDTECPFEAASSECDDRICSRNRWSCGDGQCIWERMPLWSHTYNAISCMNRCDQFFWCETVMEETLWTLPNGRCSAHEIVDKQNITDYCHYLKICTLSVHMNKNCSCQRNGSSCVELFGERCSSWNGTHYPSGALIAPYIFGYYNHTFPSLPERSYKLNGTIKCRGDQITFSTEFQRFYSYNLFEVENLICHSVNNRSLISSGGYDQFCHNDSRTFNNRSYNPLYSCRDSRTCLSVYRIQNQWPICSVSMDSTFSNEFIEKSCSNARRHRFRCSPEQTTCYLPVVLGNSQADCKNEYDEYSMVTEKPLTTTQCNKQSKVDCQFLRQCIADSWDPSLFNHSYGGQFLTRKVPFRWYCDTFPDSLSKEDENSTGCRSPWICLQGQWQCSGGHCIDSTWVLDGYWDCPDGSDEENFFAFGIHPSNQNYSWLNISLFTEKFTKRYPPKSVWSVCNATVGLLCYPNNTGSDHDTNTKHCINLTFTHVPQIDCLAECDERTVIDHCYRSMAALGHRLQCLSMQTCFTHSPTFVKMYINSSGQEGRSTICNNSRSCSTAPLFDCWNGATAFRCIDIGDCSHREDEYMCETVDSAVQSSRDKKRRHLRSTAKELQLRPYPLTSNTSNISLPNPPLNLSRHQSETSINASIFAWCNRGIPINYNSSFICFCPPQYHGEQCQYHTDRITILLHVDFTHSKYTTTTSDTSFINKYLLLFLYHDEVLSTDEFQVHPFTEIESPTKKMIYLHYSHAKDRIIQKQQRYFNRSDIVHHHPYSIRIEAYEMKEKIKPRRFAVWQYPIYFDFLPVHRLAKVLRFVDPKQSWLNPCQNRPCALNEECYQLQNQPSAHICLCKSDFSGPQCSEASALCQQNHCASNALCQPGYRGVIHGNEWPYCICPLGQVGQRCFLIPNICKSHPCANNGTCYQQPKPNQFQCLCTDEYMGVNCTERKAFIHLNLKKNTSREYAGLVIQGFRIDFVTFELRRAHQSVYLTLPQPFQSYYTDRTAPDLVLLKLYLLSSKSLHLLSVQINQTSIRADVSIDEDNQCKETRHLLASHQSQVPFIYHSLCLDDPRLLCFYDNDYLCICNDHRLGAECFLYDHNDDSCDKCYAHGQCLRGEKEKFVCICPPCYTGNRCQFNFDSFTFTLDQLFYNDLLSPSVTMRQVTFYSLILGPCLLFVLGLINNLCCFLTFRRAKCLRNGIGQYLLWMTVCNQINLALLVMRFAHLTINIDSQYSFSGFDSVFCKLSNYFLVTSTRLTQWLSSMIAIERLYVVLFLNAHWLKKPHIARRIIIISTLIILTISAYELVFIDSQESSDDGISTICALTFPLDSTVWNHLHVTVMILTSMIPFVINLVCTIGIICIVTKKKMNANKRDVFIPTSGVNAVKDAKAQDVEQSPDEKPRRSRENGFRLLKTVLIENKELVIAPAFTLIPQLFSLPFFIAASSLKCQNLHGSSVRFLVMISYFTTYIPQLITFLLYISPSSFYQREWQKTRLSKWINRLRRHHPPTSFGTKTTTYFDEKTK